MTYSMLWIYVAAMLFGAGVVGMSQFGHDVDDVGDVNGDMDHDAGLLAVFSLRNLAWASFAFGGIGVLGVLTERTPRFTLIAAAVAGTFVLAVVHVLFEYLKRSDSGDPAGDSVVIGIQARLVLPFNESGEGLIAFHANGQLHELPARRAPDVATRESALFADCEIESIDRGVALVRPLGNRLSSQTFQESQ